MVARRGKCGGGEGVDKREVSSILLTRSLQMSEVERKRSRHLPIEQWLEVVEGISGREELPVRDSSTALPR